MSAAREAGTTGLLVINADDLGRDRQTTDSILDSVAGRTVTSASAMVFMVDSDRAARLQSPIVVGLHLNLTTPFSATDVPTRLAEHQHRLARFLLSHRLAQLVYHPGLSNSFDYVVQAQLDEYSRLYGSAPSKIDGHHHMHLSANVLLQRLLPAGTLVRRSFHFRRGEKGLLNRAYRRWVDRRLEGRHRLVDYFVALPPPSARERFRELHELALRSVVEVEVHPIVQQEMESLRVLGEIEGEWRAIASGAEFRTWLEAAR